MPEIVGQLGIEVKPLGLGKFEQDIASMGKRLSSGGLNLNLNTSNYTSALGTISRSADQFTRSLEASNSRVLAFGASAGVIFAVDRAIRAVVTSTIEVEKELAQVNVILHANSAELKTFGAALFDVASRAGQGFKEAAQAATEFARQGLGLSESLKRTSDALILTRLSGQDTADSIKAITVAINGFSKSNLDSAEIVNKLIAVDNAFAVSAKDLSEALTRVGSVAQDAGVNIDQLNAVVTAAQQITGRGGAVIGNAIKSIFTRLERPEVLDQLDEIGIKVRDLEGKTLPAIEVLRNLSASFGDLTGPQKEFIGQLSAGLFQINQFKAIVSDLAKSNGIYAQSLSVSSNATTEAITRNNELNETFAATLNKTKNNLVKVGAEIGGLTLAPAIKNVLGSINTAIDTFSSQGSNSLGATLGTGLLKGLGEFISGPGLALISAVLLKLGVGFAKFAFDATKSFTDLSGQLEKQKVLQGEIQLILERNPEFANLMTKGLISQNEAQQRILLGLQEEVALRQKNQTLLSGAALFAIERGFNPSTLTKKAAGGFIPSGEYDEIKEKTNALQGGYFPGIIKNTVIPGIGKVVYNAAEKVIDFGFKQPAILPPEKSLAGANYRKEFINVHGFDPYKSEGKTLSAAGLVPGGFNPQTVIQLGQIGSVNEINSIIGNIAKAAEGGDRAAGQFFAQLKRLATKVQLTADQYDIIYEQAIRTREAGLRQRQINMEDRPVGGVGLIPLIRGPQQRFDLINPVVGSQIQGNAPFQVKVPTVSSDPQNEFFSLVRQVQFEQEKKLALSAGNFVKNTTNFYEEERRKFLQNVSIPQAPLSVFGSRPTQPNNIGSFQGIFDALTSLANRRNTLPQGPISSLGAGIQSPLRGTTDEMAASLNAIYKSLEESATPSANQITKTKIDDLQKRIANRAKFMNAAFVASIALPLIGGVASESIGQNNLPGTGTRGAQASVTGLANIGSFAATGAVLGGGVPGAIGGGILGLLIELPKIFNAFSDTLPDLQRKFEETRSSITRTSEALKGYADASDKLELIYTGQIKATNGEFRNLQSLKNAQFAQLTPQQQNKLNEALIKGGIPAQLEAKSQIEQQGVQKLNVADIAVGVGLLNQNKGNQFFKPLPATEGIEFDEQGVPIFGNQPTKRFPQFSRLGQDLATQKSNELLALRGEGGKSLLDTFIDNRGSSKDLLNADPKDFVEKLKNNLLDLKVPADQVAAATADLGKNADALYLLTRKFQGQITDPVLDRAKNQNELFATSVQDADRGIKNFANRIFETILGLEHLNRSVETNASSIKQSFGFQQEFQTIRNQGTISNQSNFSGPQTIQALTFQSNLAAIQQQQQITQKTAGIDLQKDLISNLSTEIVSFLNNELNRSITERKSSTASEIQTKAVGFVNRFTGTINENTSPELVGGINDIVQSLREQRSAIFEKINPLPSDDPQRLALENAEKKLGEILDKYNETIRLGGEKAIQNQKLEEERNKIAVREIDNQRKIGFGGGISNILNPNTNFAQDFLGARTITNEGNRAGNKIFAAQGGLQQADLLSSLGADITSIGPDLRKTIIEGLSAQIESNLGVAGLRLSGTTSTDIATKQFENRFKTESNIDQLVKNFSSSLQLTTDTNGFLTSIAKAFSSAEGANVYVTNLDSIKGVITENLGLPTARERALAAMGNTGEGFAKKQLSLFDLYNNATPSLTEGADRSTKPSSFLQRNSLLNKTPILNPFTVLNGTGTNIIDQAAASRANGLNTELIKAKNNLDILTVASNKFGESVLRARSNTLKLQTDLLNASIDLSASKSSTSNPLDNRNRALLKTTGAEQDLETSVQNLNALVDAINKFNLGLILSKKASVDLATSLQEAKLNLGITVRSGNNLVDILNRAELEETNLNNDYEKGKQALQASLINGTKFADEIARARLESTNLGIALGKISGLDALKKAGQSFTDQLQYGSKDLFRDINIGAAEMGQNLKTSFSDAVKSFADGTKNIGDALRSFGIDFATKVLNKSIDLSTNLLFGGLKDLGSAAFKGLGYSSGGTVMGGSGTKDDVPALLTSGEYVIKAPAVSKIKQLYGNGFLQQLNEGANINLANRYDFNDPKFPTAGTRFFDPNLSAFSFEDTNNPQNAIRNQKEDLLIQYLKDKAAYDNTKSDALKAFEKSKDQRFYGALISAAVGIAGAGLSSGFKAPASTVNTSRTNLPDWNTVAAGRNYSSPQYNAHAAGGSIGSNSYIFGGQSSTDNIPSLLTKGEFVVREPAARKLGKPFLDNLNRFEAGGSVGNIGFSAGSSDITDHLLQQIDLLKSISNSLGNRNSPTAQGSQSAAPVYNISVVTNVESNGKVSSNTSASSSSQDNNQSNQDSADKTRKFTELMKGIAVQTIIDNLRPNGLLNR